MDAGSVRPTAKGFPYDVILTSAFAPLHCRVVEWHFDYIARGNIFIYSFYSLFSLLNSSGPLATRKHFNWPSFVSVYLIRIWRGEKNRIGN